MMSNPELEQLGKLIASDHDLQKAALSGITKVIHEHIDRKQLQVSPELMQSLGALESGSYLNEAHNDDIILVRSVIVYVKARGLDLANDLIQLHEVQTRVDNQLSRLNLNVPKIK